MTVKVGANGRVEVEPAILEELRTYSAEASALAAGRPALHTMPPAEMRRRVEAGEYSPAGARAQLPQARTMTVPGRGGDIGLRILAPENAAPTGVYLFLHGGGLVLGRAHDQDAQLWSLVEATGMCAVSVDYRLAPEHPYPAGPDDCEDAALWLLDGGAERLSAPPVATIGGDSAGAHLAVVTLARLRDRHGVTGAFRAANLIYGWFDLEPTPSVRHSGAESLTVMIWLAEQYLTGHDAQARRDPDVSPLHADLRGLPPALFTVGDADHLLDDTLFMEARWRFAGNASRLLIWPEAPHGFNVYPVEMARLAQAEQHEFLRDAITATATAPGAG
jgi:acetyl esterase/lipase